MHELATFLRTHIASSLQRKAIVNCSQWAKMYRVMGNPFPGSWSPIHHPWIPSIQDADHPAIVVKKGAQLGFTEAALNKTFYTIDILNTSVLYVLPTSYPDASDFSTSRFDAALETSPHLKSLFSDVSNVGHKRAGNRNLYIRGSRSRSQLKSIPVGLVILDEVDEMVQRNIPLAIERLSGQVEKQVLYISTPTIEDYGIDALYHDSTQDHFYFRCPSCNRYIELTYPDSLSEDASLICSKCKAILPHETKSDWLSTGRWIPTFTDRDVKGYHINQLYSPTVSPADIASAAEKAAINPIDEQEFFNSKLGITHTPKGGKITDTEINEVIGGYLQKDHAPTQRSFITMGIDVGKWLHYEIDQWFFPLEAHSIDINTLAKCKVIAFGKVTDFESLDILFKDYRVIYAVIDANPEYRKALEFAQRFYGRIKLCYFGPEITGKHIQINTDEQHTIRVHRTSWMDLAFSRFKKPDRITLPRDIDLEYRDQLREPTRIYERDADNNLVGKYISVKDDHYAFARVYAEIALALGMTTLTSQNIS